jgi:hypothetical protein
LIPEDAPCRLVHGRASWVFAMLEVVSALLASIDYEVIPRGT